MLLFIGLEEKISIKSKEDKPTIFLYLTILLSLIGYCTIRRFILKFLIFILLLKGRYWLMLLIFPMEIMSVKKLQTSFYLTFFWFKYQTPRIRRLPSPFFARSRRFVVFIDDAFLIVVFVWTNKAPSK